MAEPPIGAKLRTALEDKGWSYTRLIAEMRRVAGRQGKTLPTTASLIAMLSRWLNGHERPSRFYREILSGALGLDLAELESGNGHELAVTLPAGGSGDGLLVVEYRGHVDGALLDDLDALTDVYRRMDRRLGAADLFEDLTRHLHRVTAFRRASMTGADRQRLASIAGDIATLMGWQPLDTGRTARAWKYFRRAAEAAKEAENPALQAFAIAEAAYIPLLGGNHRAALPLLRQARDLAPPAARQPSGPGCVARRRKPMPSRVTPTPASVLWTGPRPRSMRRSRTRLHAGSPTSTARIWPGGGASAWCSLHSPRLPSRSCRRR
jgi:transcriptional regulator with XRE-family HTH domain